MQLSILIPVCTIILALTGGLDSFIKLLGYNRTNIILLCLSVLIIERFEIWVSPELIINPSTILLSVLLLSSAIKRHEAHVVTGLVSVLLTAPLVLLAAFLFNGNLIVLILAACLAAIPCGVKNPSFSMFCAVFANLIAYYLSVMISTCLPGGAYSVIDSNLLYNTQLLSTVTLALMHWSSAALKVYITRKIA